MKKNITALFCLFYISSPSFCQEGSQTDKLKPMDFARIFQLAIDLPPLQKYFHAENDTIKKQIVFQYFGDANHANLKGVKKFNNQVLILSQEEIKKRNIKYYFVVGDWVCGTNAVRLQLSYVGENMTISFRFIKANNKWEIDHTEMTED